MFDVIDAGSPPVAPAAPTVVLPPTLRTAVRAEFGRAFRSPYETPIAVFANGVLTTVAWFLVPNGPLFTLHGALAFPVVLASWMYSDVPATNVLGGDARRVMAALGSSGHEGLTGEAGEAPDPTALWRLLVAKTAVLWLLVVPICTAVAICVGISEGRLVPTLFTIFWIAVVPLGALGISAWVGIRFPYHPIPLKQRWMQRRPFRSKIVRWTLLAVTPYVVVPYLAVVVAIPSLLAWGFTSQINGITRIPDHDFALGALLGCVVAALVWLLGLRFGVRLAIRRRAQLTAYLSDPELG